MDAPFTELRMHLIRVSSTNNQCFNHSDLWLLCIAPGATSRCFNSQPVARINLQGCFRR